MIAAACASCGHTAWAHGDQSGTPPTGAPCHAALDPAGNLGCWCPAGYFPESGEGTGRRWNGEPATAAAVLAVADAAPPYAVVALIADGEDGRIERSRGARSYAISLNRSIVDLDRDALRALRDALDAEIRTWET